MMTFLTIFLVLIGVNTVMMIVSIKSVGKKDQKRDQKISRVSTSVIYPIDLLTSNYKKAV